MFPADSSDLFSKAHYNVSVLFMTLEAKVTKENNLHYIEVEAFNFSGCRSIMSILPTSNRCYPLHNTCKHFLFAKRVLYSTVVSGCSDRWWP